MNDDSILGNTLGQLGSVIKKTGQQIVKIPGDVVEEVGDQVGVRGEGSMSSDKTTQEFVKDLYAKSDSNKNVSSADSKKDEQSEFQKMIVNKTPEEQKKLIELRQQLHSQYYQQLTNRPKPQEARPAEKVEKEKKEDLQELQQKEAKKPPSLALQRARERIEKYPGASG